jgi:hemolysin activation/secretion protein
MANSKANYPHLTNQKAWAFFIYSVAFSLLSNGQSAAQTAGQLVQDSYAPPFASSGASAITIDTAASAEVPQGAELLLITPSGLLVDGGFPELQAETLKIEASFKNKRVTAKTLFVAAAELERAYASRGYILARVTLPPQTIEDGAPLKLVVTDGFFEDIDATALPEHVRPRILALLGGLKNKRNVTKAELERQLLFVSDLPGLAVNSTLKAGTAKGGTILVLTGLHRPVTFYVSADNSLSPQLGRYVVNATAELNHHFGLGEVIYARLGAYPGFQSNVFDEMPRNRQIVLGMTLPIGEQGWWFNIEGIDSRTNPKTNQAYSIEDHYQRFSSGIGYHWLRSRNMNTSTIVSYEISDADQYAHFNGQIDWAKDKLRTIVVTQNFDSFLPWNAHFRTNLAATIGVDMFGARTSTHDLPMTRDGASPDFFKLGFNASYLQDLKIGGRYPLQLSVSSRGQSSFGSTLPASEQLGLGGPDWLSAFNSGAIQGDSAFAIRTELSYPFMLELSGNLSDYNSQLRPYVFTATGISKLANSSALESEITRATSLGFGIRLGLSRPLEIQGISFSAEFANGAISGAPNENRLNFKIASAF